MTRAVLECTCSVFFREDADGEAVEVASHFGHVIGTMAFCEGNKKKTRAIKVSNRKQIQSIATQWTSKGAAE